LILRPYHNYNRRAIPHQATTFRPNRATRGGVINDVMYNFKLVAAAAQYYFRLRTCWRHCLPKVKFYLKTKFHPNRTMHPRRRYNYCLIDFQHNSRGGEILLPVSYLMTSLSFDGQNLSANQISLTCLSWWLSWVARWLNGRASDLRSRSRGFEAQSRRCCATTLGKLFTPYCLCNQSV